MNRIIRNYTTSSREIFAQREFFGQQLTDHRQSWLEYALPQQVQAAVVSGLSTVDKSQLAVVCGPLTVGNLR
jgi:hypothetical protein